jgi:hypothetical protein
MPIGLPETRMPPTTNAFDHPVGNEGGNVMNMLTSHELAKLLMAERHQEASRERLAKLARETGSDDEHETSVWRRWALRRLVGRITLAQGA